MMACPPSRELWFLNNQWEGERHDNDKITVPHTQPKGMNSTKDFSLVARVMKWTVRRQPSEVKVGVPGPDLAVGPKKQRETWKTPGKKTSKPQNTSEATIKLAPIKKSSQEIGTLSETEQGRTRELTHTSRKHPSKGETMPTRGSDVHDTLLGRGAARVGEGMMTRVQTSKRTSCGIERAPRIARGTLSTPDVWVGGVGGWVVGGVCLGQLKSAKMAPPEEKRFKSHTAQKKAAKRNATWGWICRREAEKGS